MAARRRALPARSTCPDDPCALAKALSLAYGVIAVVKGPVTYISDGDETVRMAHGTPALAKAGTGDVLAGMIGALLAQGLDPLEAAVL
ncbi:NAD(P)H-hydrate dehydratase, partial [Eggerthella sinensis]|uniref:NAD(P)H-hydrate dehydratase n=1 Tax=Eggerthella sinensis TaxID=242230 RepID=UPI00237C0B89